MVVGDNRCDDRLFVRLATNTSSASSRGTRPDSMDNFEGVVEFVHCFGLGQLVVLYEVSPVLVDDGVEEH